MSEMAESFRTVPVEESSTEATLPFRTRTRARTALHWAPRWMAASTSYLSASPVRSRSPRT